MAATAISVVLGIAFVAGTYVLTDTLHAAFNTLFSQSAQGIAVVVTGRSALPGDQSSLATPPIPDSVVAKVGRVPGVAAADGQVVGFAQLIGPSGRPAGNPYAPTLALSVGTVPSMRVLTLQVGRLPESGSEVVVDRATAASEHLRVGQRVEVSGSVPLRPFTVVGLVDYGTAQNLGGATILGFDLRTAQAEAGTPGKVQSVDVAAEPGVTPPVLAARVAAALG
ncbi:MAG: ABC transporter permease, partial [Actinomycetota bacterium]|nr:ABC transporter permease [Actinomycetota bacterium]